MCIAYEDLQEPCDRTHINEGQQTTHRLPRTPAGAQTSVVLSHLSPSPPPRPFPQHKGAWTLLLETESGHRQVPISRLVPLWSLTFPYSNLGCFELWPFETSGTQTGLVTKPRDKLCPQTPKAGGYQ